MIPTPSDGYYNASYSDHTECQSFSDLKLRVHKVMMGLPHILDEQHKEHLKKQAEKVADL